jgi:UDP-GlcNAc:undecaprenyl-phosphate/decaprenyl-phosphate GlcNAc-1-phosphate transferase
MLNILLTFATALVGTFVTTPLVITFVKNYRLLDVPDNRKEHKSPTPMMGGIAIFIGMLLGAILFIELSKQMIMIGVATSLLFVTGIVDDSKNLNALLKLCIQFLAASIIVNSGLIITSLHGLFGITELNLIIQYIITLIAIVGVTNAFNLIDGIDGLATGLGLISSALFMWLFFHSKDNNFFYLSIAVFASLLAFLWYNFNPAKIFMGDTGSLILGLTMAIFSIRYISLPNTLQTESTTSSPILILSLVCIPVFDTLRVFALRLMLKKPPFKADRNHIHHVLIDAGLSHKQAAVLIYILSLLIIINTWYSLLIPEYLFLVLFALYFTAIKLFGLLRWIKASQEVALNKHKMNAYKSPNPNFKPQF